MKDKWIDDLRKISAEGTRRPPEGLLDGIKKTMSDRGVMPSGENAHVRRVNFAPWAIAASLAAVVACILFIRRPSQVQQMTATDFSVIENDGESELYASLEKLPEARPVPELKRRISSQEIIPRDEQIPIETITEDSTEENVTDEAPENQTIVEKKEDYQQPDPDYDAFRETVPDEQKKSRKGVSVGGGLAGLFSGSGLFSDWGSSYDDSYDDIDALSGISDIVELNGASAGKPESSDADHRRPVKFGLSFKYMINDRWGLVSGVSLSYLRSEFDGGYSNRESVNTVRKLHYIGIPLGVSWNYWSRGKTDFYLTAGGMAETLLYGKDVVKRSQNGIPYSSVSTRIHDGSVVFSTNASLGFEYRFAPHFSVYAEPGLTYYFDCGNVTSFYTDNRLNFDLRLGVRFSLGK